MSTPVPEDSFADTSSPVRVVVTPSQSSYFAGETFTVTITFTNTRTPQLRPPRHLSHTRGAHSISSAPIARPPTSPGTPKSLATGILPRSFVDHQPARKGFIGESTPINGSSGGPRRLPAQRKKGPAMSLSVSVSRQHPDHPLRHDVDNPVPDDSSQYALVRSPFLFISSKHPHARKQSVLDGQSQPHEVSYSSPHSPLPLSPFIPSASTSTFSLALDPISENTPMPSTPSLDSPVPDSHPMVDDPPLHHAGHPRSKHVRHPSLAGLGQPASLSKTSSQPRLAFSSGFSQANVELILYSYVQLVGTVHITPPLGVIPTPSQVETLSALRSKLIRRSGLGGGSMDIMAFQHRQGRPPQRTGRPQTHRRATSLSSGFLSLLSPSSLVSETPGAMSPSTKPLRSSRSFGLTGLSSSLPLLDSHTQVEQGLVTRDEVDPEIPLPTFEIQPAMLAVDLPLQPGESRSYRYTIRLPDNLPPTHRGRSMRFSYELVVGTCRASTGLSPPSDAGSGNTNSVSRVMKVPIRVYNHVSFGRVPSPYDLLWPAGRQVTPASDVVIQTVEDSDADMSLVNGVGRGSSCGTPGTLQEVQDYARMLLKSINGPETTGIVLSDPARGETELEEGVLTGCREAVDLLTRNFKKVSYDVNKDGVKVAVLTFTKSAYRLGETVLGVVELNERTSLGRVLKLSARLESQESLPSSVSPPLPARNMRRVHAEHYSSFVLSTLRTTFALDIPSDASPAFQVHIGGEPGVGGLEWKVRLCLLVAVASELSDSGTEGVRLKSMVRDGPRGQWGSAWRATKGIPPLERPVGGFERQTPGQSWYSFLASSLLGVEEEEQVEKDEGEYDGIRVQWDGGVGMGVEYGGEEEGWVGVGVETVECEVGIKVWPGNTAFKAVDVDFSV